MVQQSDKRKTVSNISIKKSQGWKVQATERLTKIKITSVNNNDMDSSYQSDCSSPIDDTDEDPDFDVHDEINKRKKGFSFFDLNPLQKRKVVEDPEMPSTSGMCSRFKKGNPNVILGKNNNLQVDQYLAPKTSTEHEMFMNVDKQPNEPEEQVQNNKGKKRKACPSNWFKQKNKILRNSGQEYISAKSKKVMPAKSVRPPCKENCKLKCKDRVNEEIRATIFKNFWDLKDINRQRDFISKSMQAVNPEYRYSKPNSKRRLNSAFYFCVDEKRIRVCKTFFVATLDIPNRYIRTAVEKTNSGIVTEDLRGKPCLGC